MVVLMMLRLRRGAIAWNGLLAYTTSAYLWYALADIDPVLIMIAPTFHSLQYLAVVWRYKLNAADGPADGSTPSKAVSMFSGLISLEHRQAVMVKFVWLGICFGAVAFWVIPLALDAAIDYREDLFGPTMFVFLFAIFINVHHYFLDNVMWRKENPDIKEHLFR
jgi:hypothetical protein